MHNLTELFCSIDDFCKQFTPTWNKKLIGSSRGPTCSLSLSEIITILIFFHQSYFRNFKHFYFYLQNHYSKEFPNLLSYSRFVRIKKRIFVPLFSYLLSYLPTIFAITLE